MTATMVRTERSWWVEGQLAGSETWHPMYGPMVEREAKRIRDIFLDTPEGRMAALDPPLEQYDDFRARHHDVAPDRTPKSRRDAARQVAYAWQLADDEARAPKSRRSRVESFTPPAAKVTAEPAVHKKIKTGAHAQKIRVKVKVKRRKS